MRRKRKGNKFWWEEMNRVRVSRKIKGPTERLAIMAKPNIESMNIRSSTHFGTHHPPIFYHPHYFSYLLLKLFLIIFVKFIFYFSFLCPCLQGPPSLVKGVKLWKTHIHSLHLDFVTVSCQRHIHPHLHPSPKPSSF